MPLSMRFGCTEHDREEGLALSLAWAARMSHFFNVWEEPEFTAIVFTAAHAENIDDLELVELMLAAGGESALWARGHEVRAVFPGEFNEAEC